MLTFNYESGGYEKYTLYNKYAPDDYSKLYYYEYKGFTGYNTYTYDGSWDYPDDGLQSDEALVMLYIESTTWDSVTLTVNGQQKARMTYFPDVYIEKVPIHSDLDIDLDFAISGDSSHRDFECQIDSYGWYSVMKNNMLTYYPGNSLVE
ncbi:MAG: hypothetical protein JEZ04_09565 [Spirochaetales bacterium]|nr:hypothetical protein [Spirochaetales bacterium]